MSRETVPALPSVEVPSLEGLSVTVQAPSPPTPDELIEQLYEKLRESAPRRTRAATEAAELGDDVVCDLIVLVDDHLIPGGIRSRVTLELREYPLLPGLVEALVGMTAGNEKTIFVTLPANYPVAQFAGAQSEVILFVHEIQEVQQPEMEDEEVLKQAGLGDTLADAMQAVAGQIDQEQGQQLLVTATQAVLAAFGARVEFDPCDELLDAELLRVWEENYEEVLVQAGFDDSMIDSAWCDYAEDPALRAEISLKLKTEAGLRALAEQQQLQPDKEALEQLLETASEALGTGKAALGALIKHQDEVASKIVQSAVHLKAVEYVMTRAHIEVLD